VEVIKMMWKKLLFPLALVASVAVIVGAVQISGRYSFELDDESWAVLNESIVAANLTSEQYINGYLRDSLVVGVKDDRLKLLVDEWETLVESGNVTRYRSAYNALRLINSGG
jgi:hypothetical protein